MITKTLTQKPNKVLQQEKEKHPIKFFKTKF